MKSKLLLILLLLFLPTMVNAEERPDTITFSKDLSSNNGLSSTDRAILYGADIFSSRFSRYYGLPYEDFTLRCLEEVDNGLNYILSNGYPNKSITGNNEDD